MLQLINKLKEANIDVLVKGNDLELHFDQAEISSELLQELKENKQELVEFLKKYSANTENNEIKAVEEAESYDLSDAQKRLWIVSQSEEGSTAYNMPTYKHIDCVEDFASFEKALKAVVERHEILRTVFRKDENDVIKQWVLPTDTIEITIRREDFSNEENPQAAASAYSKKDSFKPFDLESGPLFRVSLLKVAENHTILYYNMHHIISDGWSMDVLEKNLMTYYQAFKEKSTPDLPELNIQYKDYAAWQLDQLESGYFQEDKAYWMEKLSGELPILDLPSSKKRPVIKTFNGYSLGLYIDAEKIKKLRQFAQVEKGSLFTGLLTVLNVLLYKYTDHKDIILGTVTAGREHADLEDQIGFYVNTLALRNEINPEDSFKNMFESVMNTTLTAYKSQMYPFDKLVEDLNLSRDLSRSPLFEILVTLQNIGDRQAKVATEETHGILDLGACQSKFDLSITFEEIGDALSFVIIYNTDVYERNIMEQFMNHFEAVLENVLEKPSQKIKDIDYLSVEEKHVLQDIFNNTTINYPVDTTILDVFATQVVNNPNKTAVSFENLSLTFKQLDEKSNQLANYIIKNKIQKELVPICVDRSLEMIVGIVAILKSGNAYVPIDGTIPSKRIAYILNDCQANYVLTSNKYVTLFNDLEVIDLDTFKYDAQENTLVPIKVSNKDVAYCIYTSGTTGNPKGVLNIHEGLSNRLYWMRDDLEITNASKLIQKTPYMFDVSVWELLMPLFTGCELVIARAEGHKDPEYLQQLIGEQKINIIHFVPSMFGMFLEFASQEKCSELKHIVCSGEVLPAQLVRKFTKVFKTVQLHNYYGPTEAGIDVTAIDLTGSKLTDDVVSIGVPVANTNIYIVDEYTNLKPVGVVGELLIGGIQVAKGYVNKVKLTQEKFINSPFVQNDRLYKTGDLARWKADGSIEYIGRKDGQIKIRGNRIEFGEIAAAMHSHEAINNSTILIKERNDNKYLVAYYTAENELDLTDLKNYLREILPMYMIPDYFIHVSEFPLTSNGKLDRKALPEVEITISESHVAPSGEVEEKLVEIWASVLKLDVAKISVNRNFFELGGNSMDIITLNNRINTEFKCEISITEMFRLNTIIDMKEFILKNGEGNAEEIKGIEETIDDSINNATENLRLLENI
jgi:amino acid adenylation domain-containing protein